MAPPSRRFYSTYHLLRQHKARVRSYAEHRTAALYHAADSALHRLDSLQTRFLRELGVSETDVLLTHNLAPSPHAVI